MALRLFEPTLANVRTDLRGGYEMEKGKQHDTTPEI